MKKRKIKGGDILEIRLPKNLEFAYAKYIDLLELDTSASFPDLIRVYNYRTLHPDSDLTAFTSKGLIISPLLIGGLSPAVNSGSWKVIGTEPMQEEDLVIPHYKMGDPDNFKAVRWYYIVGAAMSNKVKADYKSVQHLEAIGAIGTDLVSTKIAMALLRDEGRKIEDYFDLQEFYEKEFYRQTMEIQPYYKQPREARGKAL